MTVAFMDTPDTGARKFSYDGTNLRYAGIVLVNTLLQFITLGIYRFWAKTRERRYIWSSVKFGGDHVEYTGTGMELFVGFLIAMFVLIPYSAIFQAAAVLLDPNDVTTQIAASIIQLVTLVFLVYIAMYRARRYRLTRTLWRGIRGGQTGSSLKYAVVAIGYWLLSVVTLGLAAPLLRIRLEAIKLENTWFGDRKFEFKGRASDLFGPWLVAWVPYALAMAVGVYWLDQDLLGPAGGLGAIFDPVALEALGDTEPDPTLLLVLIPLGIAAVFAFAWYRVREYRYLAASTSFEDKPFESSLGLGRVIWIYGSYFALWLPFVFGVLLLIGWGTAELAPTEFDPEGSGPDMENSAVFGLFFLIGLLFIILMGIFSRVFLFHRIVGAVVRSTSLKGEPDFEEILQSTQKAPGRGEGLADAFDVGGL